MSINKRIQIMQEIKSLANDWLVNVQGFGNECAYTDSIIELIQKKLNELN